MKLMVADKIFQVRADDGRYPGGAVKGRYPGLFRSFDRAVAQVSVGFMVGKGGWVCVCESGSRAWAAYGVCGVRVVEGKR